MSNLTNFGNDLRESESMLLKNLSVRVSQNLARWSGCSEYRGTAQATWLLKTARR
jgi:hypothetical protein